MELLTEGEAKARIRAMIDGRAWWVIPWVDQESSRVSTAIEQAVTRGDDFQVVLCPNSGVFAVAFARKRSLSARRLARVMAEVSLSRAPMSRWVDLLREQDILVSVGEDATADAREVILARLLVFQRWVYEEGAY